LSSFNLFKGFWTRIEPTVEMVASGWDGVQTLLGKIWTRLEAVDKLADGQETISKRLDSLEAKMNDFHARHMPKEITSPGRAKVEVSSARAPVQAPKPQTERVCPGEKMADMGMTYMLDRVNMAPMKISWAIYNKVKHLYGVGHIPEIAAKPGDDTLYVNIWDKINECKMRIPWHVWLKVKKHFLVEIWDRINNTWMTVPRAVYLKVKHHYDKDMTFMYDRINECPMRVSWHQYCKVRHLYAGSDVIPDARPGDETLYTLIPDRVNFTTMRVSFSNFLKVRHYLKQHEKREPMTFIWDKVNLCPMKVPWSVFMKVRHHYGYMLASRPGDVELHTWIWDKISHCYMRVPWRIMEKVKHHYENDRTFIWDKVNGCEMNVPWLVFMQIRHHFGFTIDPRPGDKCLHHPIWDRINHCFMRIPRHHYLNVKKYYQREYTYIYDRINQCPMKVFWPNWMKVAHYYLDFMPRLAPRPGDDTLYVWIRDKVNLTHMRVSWENYQKVKHYLMPKPNMKGARK